jgi:hypothetical protein
MEGGGKSNVSLLIGFHGVEDAPYTLPNDEDELGRLADLQNCIKLFFGKNILAPIVPKPSLIGIPLFLDPKFSGYWNRIRTMGDSSCRRIPECKDCRY